MALEDDLQNLIEKRREIDRALLERHAVEMAVLFTDIVGSTAYFEQRGDIEGLALVHRHNDLLFPVVKQHDGRVVKTIGDSIMAVFADARKGADCAVALQEKLAKETGTAAVERIRIRVGVHFGRVLKDGDDVFGDTVNTAARVASAADGDEVLLSQALVDALPAGARPAMVPRRPLSAKGKSAPVSVVAVAWRAEDKANAEAVAPKSQELFLIEIHRGPTGLRVAAMDGEAERGTVKAYADVELTPAEIEKLAEPFAVLAHDGGQGAYMQSLIDKGRTLFQRALPERVQKRIMETPRRTVRLHVEDTLVHAPWELLHDGTDFLGCRFSVGRMVMAKADAAPPPAFTTANEIVIVADPCGDLPHAAEEGRVVEKLFSSAVPGRVVHASGKVGKAQFLELVTRARVFHFAGHSVPNGFVVDGGIVTEQEVAAALAMSAPLLMFANGCHASTRDKWEHGSLAQSLLLAGVRHTLAPLWSVPDADALSFALRFYESALQGVPFGECARRARKAIAQTHASPLSFAGYVLYGDPRATLPADDAKLPSTGRTRSGDFPVANISPPRPSTPAPITTRASREETTTQPTMSVPVAPPPSPTAPPPSTSRASSSPSPSSGSPLVLGAVGGLLVGVIAVVVLVTKPWAPSNVQPVTTPPSAVIATGPTTGESAANVKVDHTGPVRVSVMPFKATGADPTLDYLKQGLSEVVVTELAQSQGVKLIERGQIDVDIGEVEFSQTKYVDPATRAQLGKINGAEIVILGSYQVAGADMRFTARFVNVESGEVLAAAKADGPKDDVFGLQDKLSVDVKKVMADVAKRMRT